MRNELLAGRSTEELVRWVKNEVPDEFFLKVAPDNVVRVRTDIINWIQSHPNDSDHAKENFATGADGWLVACEQVCGATVVTNEQPAPESKRRVKLPDVCDKFKVPWENTYVMLRKLEVQFFWTERIE